MNLIIENYIIFFFPNVHISTLRITYHCHPSLVISLLDKLLVNKGFILARQVVGQQRFYTCTKKNIVYNIIEQVALIIEFYNFFDINISK